MWMAQGVCWAGSRSSPRTSRPMGCRSFSLRCPCVTALLDDLRDTTASIYYVPDIIVFDLIQARTGSINGIPVVAMCETPFYGFRGLAKRMTDVLVSSLVLLLSAPLLIAIAVLI